MGKIVFNRKIRSAAEAVVGVVTLKPKQWFGAYMGLMVISGSLCFYLGTAGISGAVVALFLVLDFAVMAFILYILVRYFIVDSEKMRQQHAVLTEEQKKSERILFNVLPSNIAERLKNNQGLIADGYADVTVMFADLVNFTKFTEQIPPKQMVELLNIVFSGFDELSEKHGLEKIKTIGDAYMVVGGLSRKQNDYVGDMADMAIEMIDFVSKHPALVKRNLGIHIGIATGPVVAGVIGTKRFIYDLWGDTVNIASRLTDDAVQG